MRFAGLIFSFILVSTVFGQDKKPNGLLSKMEHKVIYRAYENQFEFLACESCDSTYVTAAGAEITNQTAYSFTAIPKSGVRQAIFTVVCSRGDSSIVLFRERYEVRLLPNPKIYYGSIDLNQDLSRFKDETIFEDKPFSARYDAGTSVSAKFSVESWSVNVGKNEFIGPGRYLSSFYHKAIYKAKKGTEVRFNYCIVVGPDGHKRKLQVNALYVKKTKRKTKFKAYDEERYLNPESGG